MDEHRPGPRAAGAARRAVRSVRRDLHRRSVKRRLRRFLAPRLPELRAEVQRAQLLRAESLPSGLPRPGGASLPGTPVFVYWAQGLAAAPAVVHLCYRELVRLAPGDVVLLDDTNLHEYVDLPEVVGKAAADKIVYSDVLRLALLHRYGGVWVDSTLLLTGSPTDAARRLGGSGFFAFSRTDRTLASWFLVSEPGGYVVSLWLAAQYAYWTEFDTKVDYFLTHYLFEALCALDADFRTHWLASPRTSVAASVRVLDMAGDPYDGDRLTEALSGSFAHKLTYKGAAATVPADSMLGSLLTRGLPPSVGEPAT